MHRVLAWMLFSTVVVVSPVFGGIHSHEVMYRLVNKLSDCGVENDEVVGMGDERAVKISGCQEIDQLCDEIISAVVDELERNLLGVKEMSFVAVIGKLIQRYCRSQAELVTGLLERVDKAKRDIEHDQERSTQSIFLEFSSGSGEGSGEDEYSLEGHPVSVQGSDLAVMELQNLLLRPLSGSSN